ncbi:MAG TPA: DnaJ domain-containing protein [Pseudonocardiaceae bacterium]
MPADDPDLYAILGVAPDASPAHIAHAYRRLIRAEHPDRHPHPDTAALTAAATAYAILRDPAHRAAYDQTRRPHPNQQPPPPPPRRPRAAGPDLRAGPVRWHPK